MARFFIAETSIQDDIVVITGPDVKHISRVLRLKPGAQVMLSTGNGREFNAIIKDITSKEVVCAIIDEKAVSTESPVRVTLYQGLPKGEKMELVIQKSTELGVSRIVPVVCERTIVKLDPKKAADRRERWQRVAMEAAKQSRRTLIPEVGELVSFTTALDQVNGEVLALMPWEEEFSKGIGPVLRGHIGRTSEVAVFIGPEGGFTPGEAGIARDRGICPVSLGPRILRTETAGIAAVAIILYELGDLGGIGDG